MSRRKPTLDEKLLAQIRALPTEAAPLYQRKTWFRNIRREIARTICRRPYREDS